MSTPTETEAATNESPKPKPPESAEGRVGEHGYPNDTPVAEMTPDERAAYDTHKRETNRQRRQEWNDATGGKSAAEVKAALDELAQLKRAGMTADERTLEDAKAQAAQTARDEATATFGKRLVAAELRGALRGSQVPADRIEQIVGPVDHTHFLTADGEVDADKVSNYAAGFAPAGAQWPDMGQGNRGSVSPSKPDGGELWERLYGKKK